MNIGLLTSTNPQLRQQLHADGLADAGASASAPPAESEVVAAPKPRPTGNLAPSTRFASMRAALDARIAADVSTGTLSGDDAGAVRATLDDIDNRAGPRAISGYARPAARAYLATIERGTLVDRIA